MKRLEFVQLTTATHDDHEIKSNLCRVMSASDDPSFRLLLAMLQQDSTERPQLKQKAEQPTDSRERFLSSLDYYPKHPLHASSTDFQRQERAGAFVQQQQLASMKLQDAMFPPALSLFNDSHRIPDEIVKNTDVHQQRKHAAAATEAFKSIADDIEVHEPLLHDMLEKLSNKELLINDRLHVV